MSGKVHHFAENRFYISFFKALSWAENRSPTGTGLSNVVRDSNLARSRMSYTHGGHYIENLKIPNSTNNQDRNA